MKTLNLKSLQNLLRYEIAAGQLSQALDRIIFNFIYLNGNGDKSENEYQLTSNEFSANLYDLKTLRDIFLLTAIENGETLKFDELKERFEWEGGDK